MNRIAGDEVLGTSLSVPNIAEMFDVPEDDVEELLLDLGIELCAECGWWVESGELVDDDGDLVSCSECRS